MKAIKITHKAPKTILLQAFLLLVVFLASPVLARANPDTEGGNNSLNAPAELSTADFEAALTVEEWMTQPFEFSPADFEAALTRGMDDPAL
jgi:hypothetical protein